MDGVLANAIVHLPATRTIVVLAHHDAPQTGILFDQTLQRRVYELAPGLIERAKTPLPQWWMGLAGPLATIAGAIARKPRPRCGRRRGVALGLLDRLVIGIGRVGIGAAVLHAGLEPVELRRGRRHVGIGLSRRTGSLCGGAAEIVGVGGDVAEAAHAGGLWRLRGGVVGAAARRA